MALGGAGVEVRPREGIRLRSIHLPHTCKPILNLKKSYPKTPRLLRQASSGFFRAGYWGHAISRQGTNGIDQSSARTLEILPIRLSPSTPLSVGPGGGECFLCPRLDSRGTAEEGCHHQ